MHRAHPHTLLRPPPPSPAPLQGNYDTFEKTMRERVKNARQAAEAQDMKRKHMQVRAGDWGGGGVGGWGGGAVGMCVVSWVGGAWQRALRLA